jgi:hypothetical protein
MEKKSDPESVMEKSGSRIRDEKFGSGIFRNTAWDRGSGRRSVTMYV